MERAFAELDQATRTILVHERNGALDVACPQDQFRRILDEHPVLRWDEGVAFFTMEDVVAAARDPAIVMHDEGHGLMGSREPLIPMHLDGDAHRHFRKLLDPLLAPRRIAALEPEVGRLASELIDGFVDDGEVEFHGQFAVPLPCTVFLRLFGLPVEDLEFLNTTKDRILKNDAPTLDAFVATAQEAGDELRAYLDEKLAEREHEAEPRDDLIGAFTTFEVDGERLTRGEILNIVHLFVNAGLDTVTASLSCIVGWLARNPGPRQRLVDDPTLLAPAIEELMRYENPVLTGASRWAKADTEINGIPVRAGDRVTLCWTTANLDSAVFPDPLTVDFDRTGNRHLAFAAGVHRCLGSHLARLELRAALAELHRRIPSYAVAPGRAPRYDHAGVRAAAFLPLVFEPAPAERRS